MSLERFRIFLISPKKIDLSHLSARFQLGAPGLRKAGAVFIYLWYHMKPREPASCVGNPLLSLGRNQVFLAKFHTYCLLSIYGKVLAMGVSS